MEMQQQKNKNQDRNEEDALNFDLDDISLEDIDDHSLEREEEIIELTDLVSKGAPPEGKGSEGGAEPHGPAFEDEDFELLADDLADLESGQAGETKGAVGNDVSDFALELDLAGDEEETPPTDAENTQQVLSRQDLEAMLKDEELELMSEKEVISLSDLEEMDLHAATPDELMKEEPALDKPERLETEKEPLTVEIPLETGVDEKTEDELERVAMETMPSVDEKEGREPIAVGISEERLEAAITKVAEHVLERVARETMSSIAEKAAGVPLPAAPIAAPEPPSTGISEERLEAVVTKAVEDVLERVARVTMASVAEKVINEAIESLKKSLSENP